MLNCKACSIETITSETALASFAKQLVNSIDMIAYGEPIITHFAKENPKAAGFTLIQLIETSSITGHFVDESGDAYLDVFSCKEFKPDKVVKLVADFFHPEKITHDFKLRQA